MSVDKYLPRGSAKFLLTVVGTLLALVGSLVSAWALAIDAQTKANHEDIHKLELQLPLMNYKLDLLLKAHGIEVPKETKK